MGLFQKACETYDCFADRAGVYEEGKAVLAPVAHIVTAAGIEITIDRDGKFVSARVPDKDEPKIVIPATEESSGRTSGKCAHPLCDNLGYISGIDEEKYELYTTLLAEWEASEFSTPKLTAILSYVKGGTILQDLAQSEIIQIENGKPKDEKQIVRWIVTGLDEDSGECWKDKELFDSFRRFYSQKKETVETVLCMVDGKIGATATQHLGGVVARHGKAKLISANDKSGFTYRGRFTDDSQALTIGYEVSQKAHNALKWLIANQGVSLGSRTFVCWNPQGFELPRVNDPFLRRGDEPIRYPTDYKKQLLDTLNGQKSKLPENAGAVIAAFDSATTGRLSVSYYNELIASDLLERLCEWDMECCWENGYYGIEAPMLYQIVNMAFGTVRGGRFQADDRIYAQQMQRLIACRIDRAKMPADILLNLVNKCTKLVNYDKNQRRELLFTTCAVIKKYQKDHFGREWNMALDKNCTDRSYLFGRLLAIAESVERSTYRNGEERDTNAMRMQSSFALRPLSTWRVLEERLKPYYARLSPGLRGYYQKTVSEIVSSLEMSDPRLNTKLDDVYLLGYYHQKSFKNENKDTVTEEYAEE